MTTTQNSAAHISLSNLLSMQERLRCPSETAETGHVEEVVMYRCTRCDELHEDETDAENCCEAPTLDASTVAAPACPVCGEKYTEHRSAADCCLWKDLDAYTRWKIADAVADGSDWLTELGLRQLCVTLARSN